MRDYLKFYIDGRWVAPAAPKTLDVINPATETVAGRISLGGHADVDSAVAAARKAFKTWSLTTREDRLGLLQRIVEEFGKRVGDMAVAREEIFGPVLVVLGYDTEAEAVEIGNDTEYGLAGYVQSKDMDRAHKVARQIRGGYVSINNAGLDLNVPFGGYKHSGNGREFSDFAFNEFLEVKSVLGWNPG